jgi:6-pyruvoyl-tetrahydropterin synthase
VVAAVRHVDDRLAVLEAAHVAERDDAARLVEAGGVRGPVGAMGWVCDFAEIDAVARPVMARLDHSTLNDTLPNPTSEMLCAWLLRELAAVPHLYAVEVCETERSACVVTVDDAAGVR